jgi:hypothetical protein
MHKHFEYYHLQAFHHTNNHLKTVYTFIFDFKLFDYHLPNHFKIKHFEIVA